jgi:anti-sigma factor RsiW
MMEHEKQLKLQAYLDRELDPADSRAIADWLEQDPEAQALLAELRQTSQALTGFEAGIQLPESREFYWSKIQREIQREQTPLSKPAPVAAWTYRLRRVLMPLTGLAVAALMFLVVTRESGTAHGDAGVETALQDSGAFTYHDDSVGATLVWLSYPAENEIAEVDDSDSLD